jgi:hypothetical protein
VSTENVKSYAGENTVTGTVSLAGQTETQVAGIQEYSGSSGWGHMDRLVTSLLTEKLEYSYFTDEMCM